VPVSDAQSYFPGRIGLGTWQFGESAANRARDVAAVQYALDIGYRMLDTAEMYADGGAESVIGDALKAFSAARRSEIFIISKFMPQNATRSGIARACEASIKRMGCEYLDLYLLHWPLRRGPGRFDDTLRGLDDVMHRGLIRHFGVSNFDEDDLRQWLKAEQRVGVRAATRCNQVSYCAEARGIEYGLLPWQRAHGIQTIAHSPLGRGTLAQHPLLVKLGDDRGVTAAPIALAWCLREPDLVVTPKSVDPRRIEQNLRAAELRLTANELQQIDQAFPLRLAWLRGSPLLRHARSAVRRLRRGDV
jgi:diketogulonate reductase-like aldo/keto reductase